ncbi:hypothetical protein C7C46_22050 [Streptomyces tateyamensis]|uniref:Winged helix DNA-binding domain-containing protein n=1 Tax=Streptomyces tateyamensis TaxID=565073 RepID=A0A2V4MZ09_9ACTN|nr:winged helix DNA-binding domain-containing protein [Streptomyces tateyamensis]PYC76659.1 hypothetical protein C7C46_22050 [Streptomyces tateyamensis]
MTVLGPRALNRALLARQYLLAPAALTPAQLVDHLVGLQAQAAEAPYYALWSRLPDFAPEQLDALLVDRSAVRLGLQRGTIHLVSAADCLRWRTLFQPVLEQGVRNRAALLAGLDLDAVVARGRALVEAEPRTFQELGTLLAADFPDRDPAALAQVLRARLALVQVPPRGLWRTGGAAAHTTAEQWLGAPLGAAPEPDELILRYLRAFGPASVADVQKWSGLTRLGPAVKRLDLPEFRDDRGRTLYDLPDAPRPHEATPVPVRLLAPFDNALLSHADRARILPDAYRRAVMGPNGIVRGTILVDGFVAGRWRLARARDRATVHLEPFAPWERSTRSAAEAAAERVLPFAAPELTVHEVVVAD